jgi:DNA-binding NtrC family response regulator
MERLTRSSADFGYEKRISSTNGDARAPSIAADGSNADLRPANGEAHASIAREGQRLPTQIFHGMVTASPEMHRVFALIDRLANVQEPVMIVGESGVGKDLVAQALHEQSRRKAKPYLAINCGALSPTLIESELFGHVKGSFTGATCDKTGAFEANDEGTLFLDEIGELPLDLQPKLLRVLESSCIRRIGGLREVPVRTRVVTSTHRDLRALVTRGAFREDLFHRLVVHLIDVPPLRERLVDVLPLARFVLEGHSPRKVLDPTAEAVLTAYAWPGNVRELRNLLVRAIALAEGETIRSFDLRFSKDLFGSSRREGTLNEERQIRSALSESRGNQAAAARLLGISKSTFHDRLRRYGIRVK